MSKRWQTATFSTFNIKKEVRKIYTVTKVHHDVNKGSETEESANEGKKNEGQQRWKNEGRHGLACR